MTISRVVMSDTQSTMQMREREKGREISVRRCRWKKTLARLFIEQSRLASLPHFKFNDRASSKSSRFAVNSTHPNLPTNPSALLLLEPSSLERLHRRC